MSGLTIEQVLARSLRMPRRRVENPFIGAPLVGRDSSASAALAAPTSSASTSPGPTGVAAAVIFPPPPPTRPAFVPPKLAIPQIIERDLYPDRPTLRSIAAGGIVRNSADLLSHLRSCRRLGDWRDALSTFQAAAAAKVSTLNIAHVRQLSDCLVDAGRADLLAAVAAGTVAPLSPSMQQAATNIAASSLASHGAWEAALATLGRLDPPAPIGAYNQVLSTLEQRCDWAAALHLVNALAAAHTAHVTALEAAQYATPPSLPSASSSSSTGKDTDSDATSGSSSLGSDSSPATVGASLQSAAAVAPPTQSGPPAPDAVSYATVISVLEQAGLDAEAKAVMRRMPARERDAIMASYAALIFSWSENQRRTRKF